MNDAEVERLYEQIGEIIDGNNRETVLLVLSMLYSDCALQFTHDEKSLRELFEKMANSTILMAHLEDGVNKLQAEENTPQDTEGEEARQAGRNEPKPSRPN